MILHICPRDAWESAKKSGAYEGDTLATQGFIHCSTAKQVIGVADFLFKGKSGLVLLVIDERKVVPAVKYEDAGNGERYPHIYGPLNLDAVTEVADFPVQTDGTFRLPVLEG